MLAVYNPFDFDVVFLCSHIPSGNVGCNKNCFKEKKKKVYLCFLLYLHI